MPSPTKNLILRISEVSRGGAGLGRDPEGRVVFVPFTAPGDLVEVEITRVQKTYLQGFKVRLLEPSPERVAPECGVFESCGGCEWQHLPYSLQWETKVRGVKHALDRVKVHQPGVWDEFPAPKAYGYRNRVQLRAKGGRLGYYARGTHEIVDVPECPIARPELNQYLRGLRARGLGAGPIETKIEAQVEEDGSVRSTLNRRHASLGFRQVFDEQNESLRAWVEARVAADRGELWDLFGGEGNLSKRCEPRFDVVHVVDQGIRGQSGKLRFHSSDVTAWVRRRLDEAVWPTYLTAIVDPPREGWLEVPTLRSFFERPGWQRILYIGCDPDAWARDVSRLTAMGWRLSRAGVLDFFPQTHHVECLAELLPPTRLG